MSKSSNIKSQEANKQSLQFLQKEVMWMCFDNSNYKTEESYAHDLMIVPGNGYRKVYETGEVKQNKTFFGADKIFFDPEWDVRNTMNVKELDPKSTDNIIFRRLGHLYPTNANLRPKFFPTNDYNEPLKKVEDVSAVPHCIHEMGLFPVSQFKSIFFTQDFQPSGMYHAVINVDGRWETDVVDDFIPVYEKSGKPIWGMDLEQPWQLILLKFWAKRNFVRAKRFFGDDPARSGYLGVKNSDPFAFVEAFTTPNWKYTNLSLDMDKFLRMNVNKVHKAHFVLKTKNSSHVKDSGLLQNQACYELVNLVEQGQQQLNTASKTQTSTSKVGNRKVNYIATIRSSIKTSWTGKKSVLDQEFKNVHGSVLKQHIASSKYIEEKTVLDKRSESFGLDRYFTLDAADLQNLFSSCYMTTRRIGSDFVSDYVRFSYPADRSKAYYVEFDIEDDQTFLDFSIKQPESNMVEASGKSRIQIDKLQKEKGSKNVNQKRYLHSKYILVKDNSTGSQIPEQIEFEQNYNKLKYTTYEIEYLKGYNTGDAHFLKVYRGRYILRLKAETRGKNADFVINYCSSKKIKFREAVLSPQEQTKLMKDAMASMMDRVPRINLRQGVETEVISYGDTFNYIGYGFIGAKLRKDSKVQLLIDVDPKQLNNEGYKLKHIYKRETEPFAFVVKPGESTAVVLKKINPDSDPVWPPKGIAIFQKDLGSSLVK